MLEDSKKHELFLRDDDEPSRFLVDLKKVEEESRLAEEQEKKSKIKEYYEKALEYTPKPKDKKEKELGPSIKKRTENLLQKNNQKFNNLAIVGLIKFVVFVLRKIIIGFYKVCYKTGWYLVYLVRFVYLLFAKIIISPVKLLTEIFRRKKIDKESATPEPEKNIIEKKEEVPETIVPRFSFSGLFKLNFKPALYFAIVLIVLVLPFKAFTYYKNLNDLKGRVLGISEEAAGSFIDASKSAASLDFDNANDNFSEASNKFLAAEKEIDEISGILYFFGSIIPNKELQMASYADLILESGRLSAEIGKEVSQALGVLIKSEELEMKEIFSEFYLHINTAEEHSKKLRSNIEKIDPGKIPEEYKDKFVNLKEKTILMDGSLAEFADLLERANIFLGMNQDKRYLLIFQNNTELRASGGFVGSYALIDFRNGKIINLETPGGGSYDTEAGLYEKIIAPEPLHLLNPLWHFWDANWWPDWPMSARKLQWFYEKSDGPTVDGVISLTPTVMERFLQVIGPIDMSEDYGIIFNAENFWLETQNLAEQKPVIATTTSEIASSTERNLASSTEEIKHEPKKIIGDLFNKIIEELPKRLDQDVFIGMIKVLEESFSEKHILFYFNDEELQEKIEEYGWDGRVKDTAWDYLMVVNTNIAGGKSDLRMKEEIKHTAEVAPDGSIIDTVTIQRTHTGWKGEVFSGVRNVDWMRIYVPLGSELIEAGGFEAPPESYFEDPEPEWKTDPDVQASEENAIEDPNTGTKIYNELGKTVFANWSQVDPGKTITIYLKYKLPFKLEEIPEEDNLQNKIDDFLNPNQTQLIPYALLVQKQPGAMNSKFKSELSLPTNFENVWIYPEELELNQNGWKISEDINKDKFFAVLLEAN